MNNRIVLTLTNGNSDYDLYFRLLNHSIAQRWVKHLELFIQSEQPWDDPKRFYNFANNEYTEPVVAAHLKYLLSVIKSHAPEIVTREIGNTITQDDLNYFHHIFEVYHGLYDEQDTNEFFKSAPKHVQDALGDLNIWIHRYETLGNIPRFVATWKYKPYRETMQEEDFKLFNLREDWGDFNLNYCEIGKTLYDLWHDNDAYIAPDAFKPLKHFCFDFTVRFSNKTADEYTCMENQIWNYFDQNQDFFHSQGYKKHDPKLSLGQLTIAKIEPTESKSLILENISNHQCFKSIRIE